MKSQYRFAGWCTLLSLTSCSVLLLIVVSCTETGEPSVHPDGWEEEESLNFHGLKVEASGIESCMSCHGEYYFGGTSGVDCYSCHAGGPSGHPSVSEWLLNSDGDMFHGDAAQERSFSDCARCHGENLDGGIVGEEKACTICHTNEEIVEWLSN